MADVNARRTKAIIVLVNGTTLRGDVICGASGRLESVIYDPNAFIEFDPEDGAIKFIAKQQILSVEAEKFVRQQAA
jgi:hypothetical protein